MRMEFSGIPRQDSQRVLAMSRDFAAPRALLWQAWTDAMQARCWMGPGGFTVTHWQSELRPRGAWRLCLRRNDNAAELCQGGAYLEIAAPERLVFSFAWDDAHHRRGHETRVTLTFSERQGKTTMTFRQEMFENIEQRDGHRQGWNGAFDRLAEHLVNIQAK